MKESPDRPLADDDVEKRLFPGPGLPGGGQLEVRMEAPLLHPDPDVREVARRYKPYNLDSWHTEWTLMAEKNEALAAGFEDEGRNVTAHDFYRRAAEFYRRALVYMPDTDPRMMQSHDKLKETFDKAWSLVTPPFERVEIPYEGHRLDALFHPARGKSGTRFPTVYNYGGADGILLRGLDGDAGQYVRRGMSFIDVDGPGHGATLREKKLYAPPDSESAWPRPSSTTWCRAPTWTRTASPSTAPAWAGIPDPDAPPRRNASRPWPCGAAPITWWTTSSTTTRRSRTACAG